MEKTMTLEVLSSIKGAKSSEAVGQLFQIIKNAFPSGKGGNPIQENADNAVQIDDLRDDTVIHSSEMEKEIIKGNFPKEKNGYLVVSKVIED